MIDFAWLCIEPYVFISISGDNVLLYNTLSGCRLEFCNDEDIFRLVRRLILKRNLMVVRLKPKELCNDNILRFVDKIRNKHFGDCIMGSDSLKKPVQLMSIVNIQEEFKREQLHDVAIGKNIMDNLTQITISLNNLCDNNCSHCKNGYRQFCTCTKDDQPYSELSYNLIENIIKDLKATAIGEIILSGGDIFKYSSFDQLKNAFQDYLVKLVYVLNYKNVYSNIDRLKFVSTESVIKVIVESGFDRKILLCVLEYIKLNKNEYNVVFIVEDLNDLINVNEFINDTGFINYTLQPYYNSLNMSFFEKYVYIDKKSIFRSKPSYTNIYGNQKINKLLFGRLFINYYGNVYSNINKQSLGNINNISLYDAIFEEMYKVKYWRNVRSAVLPCKDCNYKYLCPPISNYEYYLKKFNMCNLKSG